MKIGSTLPILSVLIGAAGLACADISAPSRSNVYEWRRIVATGVGTTDTLSFHWPRSRLPVKVWAQDTLDLRSHVEAGIEQWRSAFLYGEFDATAVEDSSTADVIVRAGLPGNGSFSSIRLGGVAPECEGATDFDLPDGSSEIQAPIRVFVNPRVGQSGPGLSECLALTTAHELGHAIGILAHSPDPGDLMFFDPLVPSLSSRDRATAEWAYHVEPNLSISRR